MRVAQRVSKKFSRVRVSPNRSPGITSRSLAIKKLTLIMLLFSASAGAATTDWEPSKSWVFIVGLLEWKHSDEYRPFPKKGRRDTILAERFKKLGVPADNVELIQDTVATTAAVTAAFKKFAARPAKGDTLFVYFCGHGFQGDDGIDYFATYDANQKAWAVPKIFETIEANFHGSRAVLLADCCDSGAMADQARVRKSSIEYGCLTSVLAGDTSTANWTFSDSLLDVLDGAPQADFDGDGVITFDEAAKYINGEMRFFDEQSAASSHSGKWPGGFKLAGAEAPKADKRIGEHVEVLYEGEWWRAMIESVDHGKVKVYYASPAKREEGVVEQKDVRVYKETPPAPLAVGSKVQVEWKHRWWPARIVKLDEAEKKFYITYDGYGKDWDEWVGEKRIRQRP